MLLTVDVQKGTWHTAKLSASLLGLGGRALALALLKDGEKTSAGYALCLAPGLLAPFCFEGMARLTVASRLPGSDIALASAGGSVARALTQCGFSALLLLGAEIEQTEKQLCDLVLDEEGVHLLPLSTQEGATLSLSDPKNLMPHLAKRFPNATAIVSAGHLGRLRVPFAATTMSDSALHPSSHAGGGSGMVMGLCGLRSIVLCAKKSHAFLPLTTYAAFHAALSRFGNTAKTTCSMHCANCQNEQTQGKANKWPGFEKRWASKHAEEDRVVLERYASLCDALQLDAFALAACLDTIASEGSLPLKNAEQVLAELTLLAKAPQKSTLLPFLQQWNAKPKTRGDRHAFMDTMGLCRSLYSALENDSDVAQALSAMIVEASGTNPLIAEMVSEFLPKSFGDERESASNTLRS